MEKAILTRRTVLRTAALATIAGQLAQRARAAERVAASGRMVLAWHTNIAPAGSTRSA